MKNNFTMRLVCLVFALGITTSLLKANQLTQTIRGRIIDKDLNTPVIGANIILINIEPILGSSTDVNGNFKIIEVPVGRITLKLTCIGYEDVLIQNILLSSSKELVLEIEMQESIIKMDELIIKANTEHGEILNDLAMISARAFSVEETKRYAGSFNDPARMVSSFAGVMPAAEGDNFIAVRGNSPKGNQWRLEGIEIPNPNHFSSEGATGGPINALNSAMLSNSDFFSGAFPAEYGNAFSGIFDMKLRNGNNEKREYSFSIGILGTDITLEGPFSKQGNASYLVNYRYSTLDILDKMNIVNYDGVPKYQDLSFKINLPTKSAGMFSVFGLGGKSELLQKLGSEENEEDIISSFNTSSDLGVIGINHSIPISKNTYLSSSISLSENGTVYDEYGLNDENEMHLTAEENQRKYTAKVATTLHARINNKNNISFGLEYTQYFYDFFGQYYENETGVMNLEQRDKGNAGLGQIFGTWKYRINEDLTFVGGAHLLNNYLNNTFSLEPRAGLKYQLTPNQQLSLGFGLHSRMESLPTYLAVIPDESVNPIQPNIALGFPKSRQYVIGYENRITSKLSFKAEAYFQDLYNIPVEDDPNSSFSVLNMSAWYANRVLVNSGTGYNYGLELTLERYFAENYYFMLTTSLYEAKYKAMDGILRDSRFNGNYVGNFLFGKEFVFSKNPSKRKVLAINTRFSLIGARRFTPIDLEESQKKGYTVEDESQAFTLRGDDIFIPNLSITYRVNKRRISQEIKLDIQNISNNQGMVDQYYDNATDKIEYVYQLAILPVIMYTLEF